MITESSGFDVTHVSGPIISLVLLGRMVTISTIMCCFLNVRSFGQQKVQISTSDGKIPPKKEGNIILGIKKGHSGNIFLPLQM